MTPQDLLPAIFLEHLGSASIVPFISNITLDAMRLFGGYALLTPAFVALAGMVTGCIISWAIGAMVRLAYNATPLSNKQNFTYAKSFFTSYGWMGCGLFFLPLGAIIVLVAGFLRTALWKVILASTAGATFVLRSHLF